MAFLKYLLIFLAIAWLLPKVFKFFFRMFLWVIGKKIHKEIIRQAEEQEGYRTQPSTQGEVRVHPPSKNSRDFNGGEYVEYEEVK